MEFLNKAKGILENLEIKTGEFVYNQKNNVKIAKVCADLKKSYEKLGRLTYRKLNGTAVNDNEYEAAVEKIEILKMELTALREGVDGSGDSIIFEDGEPVDAPEVEND